MPPGVYIPNLFERVYLTQPSNFRVAWLVKTLVNKKNKLNKKRKPANNCICGRRRRPVVPSAAILVVKAFEGDRAQPQEGEEHQRKKLWNEEDEVLVIDFWGLVVIVCDE